MTSQRMVVFWIRTVVINSASRLLDLTVPQSLLRRADEVIQ
jgi:hypothetical protein